MFGISFDLAERDVDLSHKDDLCVMALGALACLANQDWTNRSIKYLGLRSVESAVSASLLIETVVCFHDPRVEVHLSDKHLPTSIKRECDIGSSRYRSHR